MPLVHSFSAFHRRDVTAAQRRDPSTTRHHRPPRSSSSPSAALTNGDQLSKAVLRRAGFRLHLMHRGSGAPGASGYIIPSREAASCNQRLYLKTDRRRVRAFRRFAFARPALVLLRPGIQGPASMVLETLARLMCWHRALLRGLFRCELVRCARLVCWVGRNSRVWRVTLKCDLWCIAFWEKWNTVRKTKIVTS